MQSLADAHTVAQTVPALLTTREVAEALKVDPSTIDRWAAAGQLRRVCIGERTVRYLAADVAALISPTHELISPTHQQRPGPHQGAAKQEGDDGTRSRTAP